MSFGVVRNCTRCKPVYQHRMMNDSFGAVRHCTRCKPRESPSDGLHGFGVVKNYTRCKPPVKRLSIPRCFEVPEIILDANGLEVHIGIQTISRKPLLWLAIKNGCDPVVQLRIIDDYQCHLLSHTTDSLIKQVCVKIIRVRVLLGA